LANNWSLKPFFCVNVLVENGKIITQGNYGQLTGTGPKKRKCHQLTSGYADEIFYEAEGAIW
jgi:hypothetical protein